MINKVLLISIKPEFADKIFNGKKKIELRKSMPSVEKGDWVIVYSTDPVKAVVGICEVKNVIKTSRTKMWKTHSKSLGINQKRFWEYYSNNTYAIGIELTKINKLDQKVLLSSIKKSLPKFAPPQTFRYYTYDEILKALNLQSFEAA
jgi:predicted transcriptional regulator